MPVYIHMSDEVSRLLKELHRRLVTNDGTFLPSHLHKALQIAAALGAESERKGQSIWVTRKVIDVP